MEANYKRTITNLESELNIKGGMFQDMTGQLKQLQEQNMSLNTDMELLQAKVDKSAAELQQKEEAFQKMGESLAMQAQEKAMLKMENMNMKNELMMA